MSLLAAVSRSEFLPAVATSQLTDSLDGDLMISRVSKLLLWTGLLMGKESASNFCLKLTLTANSEPARGRTG
jgi:hypothetical protein